MKMRLKRMLAMALAGAMLFSLAACGKQEDAKKFPEKQVTIIMPWSVGGGPDTIARKVASYGEKYLGVPVIVENHTGGSGTVAMSDFLEKDADGYTMIVANGPLFSLTPGFISGLSYKLEDISPLIGMRQVEFVVLSNPQHSQITSMDELKSYAAAGNTIKYATTGGPGNDSYTMISVLFKRLGLDAEAVPFDGGQEAINALAGGHVDIAVGSPPVYREYVKNGEFACLGTFIPEGIDVEGIGNIPSFKSQGIEAEFVGMDYFAVRSEVDAEKQKILREFIQKVYDDPEFQSFMSEMGMQAWRADNQEILEEINKQTEDMKVYIELLK